MTDRVQTELRHAHFRRACYVHTPKGTLPKRWEHVSNGILVDIVAAVKRLLR